MDLSQVAQHLLAVCCRVCCHQLVLTSNLHQEGTAYHKMTTTAETAQRLVACCTNADPSGAGGRVPASD